MNSITRVLSVAWRTTGPDFVSRAKTPKIRGVSVAS
jgi:hypothetical protein